MHMGVVKFVEGEREAPGFVAWRERDEKEWGGSPSWITKASVLVKRTSLFTFFFFVFKINGWERERERDLNRQRDK
jgi:hypothetical protein